jgi:hypothetical protein
MRSRFFGLRATIVAACATLVSLASAAPSRAGIVYAGSSGSLSASADFSLSGNTLTVILTNTSAADVLVPSDVLTGVFFNTTHTLTPVSASLNGSTVFYGSLTNVGDGWGYASGVLADGENSAISASGAVTGLGHSNFSGANNMLQNIDYGILSAGDNSATGNGGVTGHGPLIKNSVLFTLTAASGFSLSELGDSVVFQYGTQLTETHFSGNRTPDVSVVPAPPSSILLGIGVAVLAWQRLPRRRLSGAGA